MPSVQVTNKDWNSEVKDDELRVKQQIQEKVLGKAEHPEKMPCNPSSASQSPPPTDGELRTNHHDNNIHSNGSTVEEAKSKMATVDRYLQPKTSSGKVEDLKVSVDMKPRQATKTEGQKKFEPKIFALLYKEFKEHRCLGKQRSVSSSYEKETHVFTHALSAPGALSVCKESPKEEQVFNKDQTGEKNNRDQSKKDTRDGNQVDVETKDNKTKDSNLGNKDEQKDDTEARGVEKQDVEKDDSCLEHPEKTSPDDRPQADKADAGTKEATEGVSSDAGERKKEKVKDEDKADAGTKEATEDVSSDAGERKKEKVKDEDKADAGTKEATEDVSSDAGDRKKEKVKDEEEAKKTVGDIDSLTQSLQTSLKLDDREESKSKGGEVPKLAKDHIQSRIPRDEASSGGSGLRARGPGIHTGPIMGRPGGNLTSNTNYGFGGYPQSQLSHNFAVAQPRQTQTQPQFQTGVLPPFNKAFMPSVVSPPGQGNFMPYYMNPGTVHRVQGSAIAQSKQGQLAQNALSPQNQAYPLNDLSRGGLSFQTHPQKPPAESTGQPVEVSWPGPLTPESITDMIDSMTSDEESVKSPMDQNEMEFLSSPQSPWLSNVALSPQHSPYAEQTAPSSVSPQHSPYHDPQGSPFQRVPDTSPYTPESNMGSPGESLPPESPTYSIQMGMTAGSMTVQDRSFLPPRAGKEEEKKIDEIKRMLMTPSDPSQSPPQFFPGLPPQPNYMVEPYVPMPPVSPPTPVIPTFVAQNTPSQMYPPGVTPYMEELEEFKALVADHTVEELLATDKDRDTVLHLAICKDKVALSVAMIERLWTERKSLDLLNNLHQTPLYLSVVCKLDILTEILITHGASLGIGNIDGNTPLHAAAMMGNAEAIKTIIRCMSYRQCSFREISAFFDATNFEGKTALMLAVEAHSESLDCTEVIKELLMNNANPMFPDCQSGKTALHYAVELQKMVLIYILLEESQDASKLVNAKMYNGNTALHLIVGRAIPEVNILHIVGILMSSGANVSLSNDANEKPIDLVRREHVQVKHHLHGREHHKR